MAKKIFPKIKKKIKGFLTDESGKISKKDALGLAIGGMLLGAIENVGADITTSQTPALPYPPVTDGVGTDTSPYNNNAGPNKLVQITSTTCSHASGIVNGHYSATPSVNTTQQVYNLYSHASHASHGSHGSHCSCSRFI